ncbi:MAG: right-handed parallel beta-helix repeat-containing protein [Nitrososphaerota archaeon]|nr:right-handed parallel beta-helix repeat-containing protein [Nitrososphaerota archaeon]
MIGRHVAPTQSVSFFADYTPVSSTSVCWTPTGCFNSSTPINAQAQYGTVSESIGSSSISFEVTQTSTNTSTTNTSYGPLPADYIDAGFLVTTGITLGQLQNITLSGSSNKYGVNILLGNTLLLAYANSPASNGTLSLNTSQVLLDNIPIGNGCGGFTLAELEANNTVPCSSGVYDNNLTSVTLPVSNSTPVTVYVNTGNWYSGATTAISSVRVNGLSIPLTHVVTDQSLTLQGLGNSSNPTVIEPTSVTTTAKDPDTGAPEAPIILVNDTTGVTVQNLVVNGSAAGATASSLFGILYMGASGVVKNNTVTDVHLSNTGLGYQTGNAIEVQTPSSQSSAVTIENNVVTNYQKNGITCNDAGTTCDVTGNVVFPLSAAQNVTASNGIQVAFNASGMISQNAISGNTYLVSPYYATGVLDYLGTVVNVFDNNVSGNAVGITNYGNPTSVANITGNTLSNNVYEGIEVDQPGAFVSSNTVSGSFVSIDAISYQGDTANLTAVLKGNTVSNGVENATAQGFFSAYFDSTGVVSQPTGILVLSNNTNTAPSVSASGNSISGMGIGILVNATSSTALRGTLTATQNSLSNNGVQYIDSTNTTNIQKILSNNIFDHAVIVTQSGQPLYTIWSSVGNAVGNATSGDTVTVAPGTYDVSSPTIITVPLTITSETGQYATGGVTLVASSSESVPCMGEPSVFQLGGTSNMCSNAGSPVSGVTIEGLNFVGAGIQVPGIGAANVTIANNNFTNLFWEAIGYHGNPIGTGAGTVSAPLDTHILIIQNSITNVGCAPGVGSTSCIASGIAMWLGNMQESAVVFNHITNTSYAGILLTGTAQGDEGNNLVFGNVLTNIPHQGIQIAFGNNVNVANNNVTNAGTAASNSSLGATEGRDCAVCVYNPGQTNIRINSNSLLDSYDGVGVAQVSGALGTGIQVNFNRIAGNTHDGVANYATSGALDATHNYWGCTTGPNTTGCDSVYGNVTYIPWLTLPTPFFQIPQLTFVENGLAPGTAWSVTLNGTTITTTGRSISVPAVLDSNPYLTEFALGQYNISVSARQPYAFAFWSSNTTQISLTSPSVQSTMVDINGSGTIAVNFGLPLSGSFSLTSPLSKGVVGTTESVNATFTNNLQYQFTGVVWFQVENATTGQTIQLTAPSLTLAAGSSGSAYLALSTLAPGTYTVEVFVVTAQGVPISVSSAVTVTVP